MDEKNLMQEMREKFYPYDKETMMRIIKKL